MSLIKYKAFVKVCELGSISKAAAALGYSQPGVSHMIESLEEEFGFPIISRSSQKIQPTKNGSRLLYCCNQIIKNKELLDETVSAINGLISGSIVLSSMNSLLVNFVPQIIRAYTRVYSNIEVSLQENTFSEIQTLLKNDVIDLGFVNDEVPKGFDFIPLIKDPVCIAMSVDHPLCSYEKVPIQALNSCDFIMPMAGYEDLVRIMQKDGTFRPNCRYSVASDTAGMALAACSLGVYPFSRLQTSVLPENTAYRELAGDEYYRTLGIALRSYKHAAPGVREFVKIAVSEAKRLYGDIEKE